MAINLQKMVQSYGQVVDIKKYEYVFRQGDTDSNIYLLEFGLLKAYYLSSKGKETIKSFISSGSLIASLTAVYRKEFCSFNLIALHDSRLFQLPFAHLSQAAEDSHSVALELVEVLLQLSMKKENREYELLALPAHERYRKLCEISPELLDIVTQNDIAHYLGITPVALSRIKKRLKFTV